MYQIPADMQPGCIHETNSCGLLEVVSYKNAHNVCVKFIGYDYKTVTSSTHIRNGKVLNKLMRSVYGIGYLGDGPHRALKTNAAYGAWARMLRRCYDTKFLAKYPTYTGCTVHPEWHNFQNFANWYYENHPKDGLKYELDKDIKHPGNKEYAPDKCLFVTHTENSVAAMAKHHKLLSPDGEVTTIYNLKDYCRGTNLNHRHMCEVSNGKRKSHKGWKAA